MYDSLREELKEENDLIESVLNKTDISKQGTTVQNK